MLVGTVPLWVQWRCGAIGSLTVWWGRGGGRGQGQERVPEPESTIPRVTSLQARDSGTWAARWTLHEKCRRDKERQLAKGPPPEPSRPPGESSLSQLVPGCHGDGGRGGLHPVPPTSHGAEDECDDL